MMTSQITLLAPLPGTTMPPFSEPCSVSLSMTVPGTAQGVIWPRAVIASDRKMMDIVRMFFIGTSSPLWCVSCRRSSPVPVLLLDAAPDQCIVKKRQLLGSCIQASW
jgi:hypothetical protein